MYVRVKEKQRAFGKGEDIMSSDYRDLKGKKRENLGEQRFFNDKHKSSRQSGKCKGEPEGFGNNKFGPEILCRKRKL